MSIQTLVCGDWDHKAVSGQSWQPEFIRSRLAEKGSSRLSSIRDGTMNRMDRVAGKALIVGLLTLQGLFGDAAAAQKTDPGSPVSSAVPPVTIRVDLNEASGPFTPVYNW